METILNQIPELAAQGKKFVLCLITQTTGSVPRKAGVKMLVFPDGTAIGTIGGGVLERDVIKDALKIGESGKPSQKTYTREGIESQYDVASITVYFELFGEGKALYIFGAGHVGSEIARYATGLGFRIIIIDPREEQIHKVSGLGLSAVKEEYVEYARKLELTQNDFSVITTHSHEIDRELLGILASQNPGYLGMIGSKRKVEEIRKFLIDHQIATREQLERVDMPMGLPIGAETPAEIAISVVAKLIEMKKSFHP
jgi:xanthine dehydrogenase accessory factor